MAEKSDKTTPNYVMLVRSNTRVIIYNYDIQVGVS